MTQSTHSPADHHANNLTSYVKGILPLVSEEVAPATFGIYRAVLDNHVLPRLGHLELENVKPSDVNELVTELCRTRSSGIASQARSALGKVMSVAVSQGILSTNPVKAVRASTINYPSPTLADSVDDVQSQMYLTRKEGALLLRKVRRSKAYWPILLYLRFGLRVGECLGLRWSDIDLGAKVLRVRRRATFERGLRSLTTSSRSATYIRNVPIATDLLTSIATAKRNAEGRGQTWVCVNNVGKPLTEPQVTLSVREAVIAAGFDGSDGRPVPNSLSMRSSFLYWLANHANGGAGVKPHALMRIAGHSTIAVAMKHYESASDADMVSAIDSLYMDLSEQDIDPALLDEVLEDEAA